MLPAPLHWRWVQSGLRMIDLMTLAQLGLIKAYHINQRNEGIDLGSTAGCA